MAKQQGSTADLVISAAGHLAIFAHGLIFLPDYLEFDPDLVFRIARGVSEHALSKLVDAVTPVGKAVADGAAKTLISLWIEGIGKHHESVKSFEELFQHASAFFIPHVDIVEISRQRVQRWWRSTDYFAITAESATGEKKSYCMTIVEDVLLQYTNVKQLLPFWPGILLQWRFNSELDDQMKQIKTEMIDEDFLLKTLMKKYDAPQRHIILMVSLLLRFSDAHPDDVAKNLVKRYGTTDLAKAGAAADTDFKLTCGEFVDFVEGYNEACRKQLDEKGFTAQFAAASVLKRLGPLLNHYKQVPVMAHGLEVIEAVARGETNPDWTPNWTPDY